MDTNDITNKIASLKLSSSPSSACIYTGVCIIPAVEEGTNISVSVCIVEETTYSITEFICDNNTTYNGAELYGLLLALCVAECFNSATVYSRSQYAIQCVTVWYKRWTANNWKTSSGSSVADKEVIMDVIDKYNELILRGKDIKLKHSTNEHVKHNLDAKNIAKQQLSSLNLQNS